MSVLDNIVSSRSPASDSSLCCRRGLLRLHRMRKRLRNLRAPLLFEVHFLRVRDASLMTRVSPQLPLYSDEIEMDAVCHSLLNATMMAWNYARVNVDTVGYTR
eukprot:gb/GECG01005793.1/.p1 GENE.gb/GECG01005793.1/~~gb/GECG01005793.1/.p1  ORF type:complete len:103 (+),score=9.06 gb/GECG01005793.1/:1-309(+)